MKITKKLAMAKTLPSGQDQNLLKDMKCEPIFLTL